MMFCKVVVTYIAVSLFAFVVEAGQFTFTTNQQQDDDLAFEVAKRADVQSSNELIQDAVIRYLSKLRTVNRAREEQALNNKFNRSSKAIQDQIKTLLGLSN